VDPHVSERNRGTEEDDGGTRRRWLLQRRQRCFCVHYISARLAVSLIDAFGAATEVGDEHGGAWPRHGRLRRDDGVADLKDDPTSISGIHWT